MTYPCFQEDQHPGHAKMVDMQSKGVGCRIKKCACELLSLGSDLMDDAYSWDLMGRDIRLKSMFLYCDLSQLISNVPKDQKKALTEVGNKLFSSIEELDHAVKIHSIPLTRDRYNEAGVILQELLVLMP
ncbi:PREDICTED: oxygen-evolving enhancer protein 3, chloroplastic-like isoform X1 [Fragaria vesca subsp. vesca]|uniref:oxygen-evolving enhancer protein 3, chloroplastic-like isoform X1 n=2 Tax=Fragaria vesca subsp. vesca TaxID=101020 RepID=UPI0002C33354|nr:PREDICTED: oxygen-evolving enhancer protein 3, chloroplastic-like isoform X1 [Fragaria vesca subsp. vesca]XP_004297770.1 PREDICTED: oxygen-evolving enhancer protein 3, chloroplastic-like isoform X1 [Fragaria vesca subsp. vesca]